MATLEALDRRSRRDVETGCLRWTGAHTPEGYGQITLNGRPVAVHRAAYESAHGPIPADHDVDHVYERGCRYRDCIEPSHLEAVTHAENVRRQVATITQCPSGHDYSEANTLTYTTSKGYVGRRCWICKKRDQRVYKQRKRALNG